VLFCATTATSSACFLVNGRLLQLEGFGLYFCGVALKAKSNQVVVCFLANFLARLANSRLLSEHRAKLTAATAAKEHAVNQGNFSWMRALAVEDIAVKNLPASRTQKAKRADPLEPHDALVLLAADHAALLGMFRDFERRRKSGTTVEKGKLALRICHLMSLHAETEQGIFYPAAERVLGKQGETLLVKARVEHDIIKTLVEKIEQLPARHAIFDATVKVLGDHAARHFQEEEEELFGKLRHSKLDLAGLGEQLAARQLELGTASPDKKVLAEGRRVMGR
jgi:hypothetical protein